MSCPRVCEFISSDVKAMIHDYTSQFPMGFKYLAMLHFNGTLAFAIEE